MLKGIDMQPALAQSIGLRVGLGNRTSWICFRLPGERKAAEVEGVGIHYRLNCREFECSICGQRGLLTLTFISQT